MHHAVEGEEFRPNPIGMGDDTEDRIFRILQGLERNLNDLVQGLSLLGVQRCAHCKKFFRSSSPGALFGTGAEMVCFGCIPAWWPIRREQLSAEERQKTESDLVYWLRGFHNARSYSVSTNPDENEAAKFEITANCLECRGTGKYLGDKRCRYCSGPGAIRIVVPQRSR